MIKPKIFFSCDTENTVPKGHDIDEIKNFKTEVWAAGLMYVCGEEDTPYIMSEPIIYNDFSKFLDFFITPAKFYDVICYFHNLAWDGTLLIDHLCRLGFEHAPLDQKWRVGKKQFKTLISDMGLWYEVKVRWKGALITFRDSAKILPFTLDSLGKSFKTKHQKLVGEIDYTKERHAGEEISAEDMPYVMNDVFVLKETLEKVEPWGLLERMTIGSCALADYKQRCGASFDDYFPELSPDLDEAIRASYHGGWCYAKEDTADTIIRQMGEVYDVNSLYPYAMHSKILEGDQRHIYPVGYCLKELTDHDDIENFIIENPETSYFIEVRADFTLKEKHLPFIQEKYCAERNGNNFMKEGKMEILCFTRPDFELFFEQYDVGTIELRHLWVFASREGIFDEYIDYWTEKKIEAGKSGDKVQRQIAKLFLNNLYGKFSTGLEANSKIPVFDKEKDMLSWIAVSDTKHGVYIPVGSYITSYARCKTIRAAQQNYDIFLYADTDSIHCIGKAKGLQVDPFKLGAWKNESSWDKARFVRQKTYIEHTIKEDCEPCEPYWNVKACGAPDECKRRMQYDVENYEEITEQTRKLSDDEFMERFTYGLEVSGKLARKSVRGGLILYDSTFKIH